MSSQKKGNEDEVLDLNSLRTFTIPKRKKSKQELFENISLTSREYLHEVLPALEKNYKDRDVVKCFKYTSAHFVHHQELLSTYLEKRKELRQDGYSEKETQDSYAFLCVDGDNEVKQLCEEGVHVGNTSTCVIGNPEMGVCLCKHPDISRSIPFYNGSSGAMIIFKVIKGKVKVMVENRGGVPLDPTPNYDCHVSKNANTVDLALTSPQYAFESTQLYLYEYGDLGVEERPRQILPYAVVQFNFKGNQKAARPPLLKQVSPKVSTLTTKPPARMPTLSPAVSTPRNSQRTPTPKHPSQPPGLDPQHGPRHQPKPKSIKEPRHSQESHLGHDARTYQERRIPQDHSSTPGSRIAQEMRKSKDPRLKSRSSSRSSSAEDLQTSSRSSTEREMGDEPVDRVPVVSQIGEAVGEAGTVVWGGHLMSQDKQLCPVELVVHGSNVKPARIGPYMCIGKRLPLRTVRSRLADLSSLPKDQEVCCGKKYYSYGTLRPAKEGQATFSKFLTYLSRKASGATSLLDSQVEVILLAMCEVILSLGLSKPENDPMVLHCIFISSISRKNTLLGKDCPSPQVASPRPPPSPAENRPVPSPSLIRFTPPLNSPTPSQGGSTHGDSMLCKDLISDAFKGQAKQAFPQYDIGPPSVGSQHSADSWSLPPSPGVFSPSPGIIHNVDDLHPTTTPLFKEPPNPTRLMHGDESKPGPAADYDDGYQKYVPVESLVYKKILLKTFQEQTCVQDKRNIDVARRKVGAGMGPPAHRPSSRTSEGSPLSAGSVSRRRTPSQDSGSVGSAMSPMVTSVTSSKSESYSSPAGSSSHEEPSPHIPVPTRIMSGHVIGPHGQHIEPISPAGSGSGSMEPPSPVSPYQLHPPPPYDPTDQHAQMLQQQLHQKMSPLKGSPGQPSPGFTAQSPSMPLAGSPYNQPPKEVPIPAYHGPGSAPIIQPGHSPLPPGQFSNVLAQPGPGKVSVMDYNHQSVRAQAPDQHRPPASNQLQGNIPSGGHTLLPSPGPHQMFQSVPGQPSPQFSQVPPQQQDTSRVIGQMPGTNHLLGQSPDSGIPSGSRVDPRLLRRQTSAPLPPATVCTATNIAGIPQPITSNSILENILMTNNSLRPGIPVTATSPQALQGSSPAHKFTVSGSHVIPSPQLGIPSRDPRLGPAATTASLPATNFSQDGSQNLTKSLSVGTTTTPPRTVSSTGKTTSLSPAPSQPKTDNLGSSSNINQMLSSLIHTLTGTIGSPGTGTPPTSTSNNHTHNNSSSTTTMTLATGDTMLCQTEGLSADLTQTRAKSASGQSMGSRHSSAKQSRDSVPPKPLDDGDLPYEPGDDVAYDPSDVVALNTEPVEEARFSSEEEVDAGDEIVKRPSLASVAKVKEDFDSIISQPKTPTKTKTEEDLKLSEDLINLIVVGQPLAAKAARELKKQIEDIEVQSKIVEDKIKDSQPKLQSEGKNDEPAQKQPIPEGKDDSRGSGMPDSSSKRTEPKAKAAPITKKRRSRESSLEKTQPPKRRNSRDDEKKRGNKVKSTKEDKGATNSKSASKQSETGEKSSSSNPLEFLQPAGTVPLKSLGRIPKRPGSSTSGTAVHSPSEDSIPAPKFPCAIKEIPMDVQSEDVESESVNGHVVNSRRLKCIKKELAYYSKVYDGASKEDLLALGLDYIPLRFLGGAKVQKDGTTNDLHVTIDRKARRNRDKVEDYGEFIHETATRDSVRQVIHSAKDMEPITETSEQKDRVLLWHIALHYLLPLIEEPDQDSREVVEADGSKPDTEVSQKLNAGQSKGTVGKMGGRDRSDQRHHPYRRQAARSREEQNEKDEIFKCYRSYRDLDDLMQCLTSQNFRSRRTRPLSNIFQGPFSKKDPPRFKNYTFKRNTFADLERGKGLHIDQEEIIDKQYSMEEVEDFQKRRNITKALDSELNKSVTQHDMSLEQFELEKQVYGEDENKNKTEKNVTASEKEKVAARSVSNAS